MKKFYITAAIPYVNAKPHVGHALEFIQTDVLKRYHALLGENTLMLSGGDENALKNVQAAEKAGKPVQQFVDENTHLFQDMAEALGVHFDVFQKGSSANHHEASQKLWELCAQNGDIYKKQYTGLYCVGCEQFYEEEELNEDGECFEHPGKKLEEIFEENYFFRLSKYQQHIINLIESGRLTIIPDNRKNEVVSFVKSGLKDISISRSNARAKDWGVPVPGDESQRMYVWFDALNIYQSGVGFGWDEKLYGKWWPADVHVIGKGIIRFHAVYWPAFLMSAGLQLPKALYVHGYFTVNGQKMSKTLGNVIDPLDMVAKFGKDALRYYFLRDMAPTSDGDFSEKRLAEIYASDLANELGNLVSRVTTIGEKDGLIVDIDERKAQRLFTDDFKQTVEKFEFNRSIEYIWTEIKRLNKEINEFEPWAKTHKERKEFMLKTLQDLHSIGYVLQIFIPDTGVKIIDATQGKIKKSAPLFPRMK